MDDMTDFEKAYNRIFRGSVADTRHINDSEEVWNEAIKFERARVAKTVEKFAKFIRDGEHDKCAP